MSVFTEEAPAMTVEEFTSEINRLEGERLRSSAIAFNTQRFVDTLLEDGFVISDVKRIFVAYARRFAATGQRAPDEGAVNLNRIAKAML